MEIIDIWVPGSSTKSLKMRNSKISENGCLPLFRVAISTMTQSRWGEGRGEGCSVKGYQFKCSLLMISPC